MTKTTAASTKSRNTKTNEEVISMKNFTTMKKADLVIMVESLSKQVQAIDVKGPSMREAELKDIVEKQKTTIKKLEAAAKGKTPPVPEFSYDLELRIFEEPKTTKTAGIERVGFAKVVLMYQGVKWGILDDMSIFCKTTNGNKEMWLLDPHWAPKSDFAKAGPLKSKNAAPAVHAMLGDFFKSKKEYKILKNK